MGLPQLQKEGRKAVIVGPKEGDDSTYFIVLHAAVRHGEEPVKIDHEKIRAILEWQRVERQRLKRQPFFDELDLPGSNAILDLGRITDSNYIDPVAARDRDWYQGRWLAGFAPIGNTEFGIIVQKRYDEVIPVDYGIILTGAAVLLGALLMVAVAWFAFQRLAAGREKAS